MTNFLVVSDDQQVTTSSTDQSILGFRSILPSSSYSGEDEDPLYPFVNALDFRDNTKYSPNISSGTVTITFNQSSLQTINYFAFAIHNSQDAVLIGKFEVDTGSGFELVTDFSVVKNNRPFLVYFGEKITQRQRLTLNFTSKLFIGSINVGNAIVFDRAPSLGFQPGRFASKDRVEQFTTDGNNFIVGRRLSKGFETKGVFRFVNFENQIEDWFEEYMNHVLDSKTLYFKWNTSKDQTIYGLQNPNTLQKPTYVTSFYSDINFEINGYA